MKENIRNGKPVAALITGASSGIGKEIASVFLKKGIEVIGIGRTFHLENVSEKFHPFEFDLTKTNQLPAFVKELKQTYQIQYLVNNAGVGYFGLHEELNAKKIHEMTAVNLEAPLILTQLLLRDFKKTDGTIINISSITAKKSNPHGCAYGATKAALSSFSASLFDEARKYGIKVCTIHPDMTQSNFYRHADFKEGASDESYLLATEVAEAVSMILDTRKGLVVSDLTIQPQKHQLTKL